jgi:cytochrome bd-type quinol oxidase subunit 2
MHRKLRIITATVIGLATLVSLAGAFPVAAANPFQTDACSTLNQVSSSEGCGSNSSGTLTNTLSTVINVFSFVVGAVAVIMIVVMGLKFITSQGDASAVASARSGIVYALVGLAVVALAQVIVHFVLGKI